MILPFCIYVWNLHVLFFLCGVRVRKREDALFIGGHNAAHSVKKLKALENQPVNSSFLLLSNVEFEKGKEVYESDKSEEENDLLENVENPPAVNADSKKRKRNGSEKLQCSMYVIIYAILLACYYGNHHVILIFAIQCLNGFVNIKLL